MKDTISHTPGSSESVLIGPPLVSRQHLLRALETSVIVAVTDVSGTIREANDAFCRFSGSER